MSSDLHLPASRLADRLIVLASDIKLSHSVFALPFGLLATFMAAAWDDRLPGISTLGLIVLCMVLARTTAMVANRWADARLDAVNPRTARRAIPSGRLTRRFALVSACISGGAFVAATAGFWVLRANIYPFLLSPFVLAWLVAYSLTKRFTWCCHLILGVALALSPLAASLAVQPLYLQSASPYLLAVMVMCWVGGFDIIYALQDVASDKQTGVYSIPARLGVTTALWISRVLHGLALAALVGLWQISPVLGTGFAFGIAMVAFLLILEHALVWGSSTCHIHMAFFTVNGVISIVLGMLGIGDVVYSVTRGI